MFRQISSLASDDLEKIGAVSSDQFGIIIVGPPRLSGDCIPSPRPSGASEAEAHGEDAKPSNIEIEFWSSIKDSDQPDIFDAYPAKYPDGEFCESAELRLGALRDA